MSLINPDSLALPSSGRPLIKRFPSRGALQNVAFMLRSMQVTQEVCIGSIAEIVMLAFRWTEG